MELSWKQIKEIANYLDDKVIYHFHDAIVNSIGDSVEVSDEDILKIKEQLRRIL